MKNKKQQTQSFFSFIRRAYQLALIIGFLTILLIPLANLDLNPATFRNNFYGRLRLVRLATDLRVAIGDRVFTNAIIGKDGWLYQTFEEVMRDYQNDMPLSDRELETIQQNMDGVADYFKQQGISLVVTVAPNKGSIYPQHLPDEIQKLNQKSRFDQVVEYLQQHGRARILDLRPELIAARNEHLIYYLTDSHWTDYGAFIAYRNILTSLQEDHPQLKPRLLADFETVSEGMVSMDLARMIGSIKIKEEKILLKPKGPSRVTVHNLKLDDGRWMTLSWNQKQDLPRAVVYYDSYLQPNLSWFNDHFSQVTYIPHYANLSIWNLSWVNQQQADVVIVEIAEKYIHDLAILFNPEKAIGLH